MAAGSDSFREMDELFTTTESEDDEDYYPDNSEGSSSNEVSDDSDFDDEDSSEEPDLPSPRNRLRPTPDARHWNSGNFVPKTFNFDSSLSGFNLQRDEDDELTELDSFKLIFSPDLLQKIVTETNGFFQYVMANSEIKPQSKLHKWTDLTVEELYLFFGVFMLMAHQKKMKMRDYWSTDPLIATPIFGHLMSSDRFRLILRLLHFNSNDNQTPGDKLHKVRPVLLLLKETFREILIPHQTLCIDESLMLWKGCLSFKQYIPSKRHRFGIKLFIICDVITGFILEFIVYTGLSTEVQDVAPGLGKSGAIVLTLMEPYLNKGHVLYIDNWYSSRTLAEKLYENNTGVCGTVKANRLGMPVFPGNLKKGDCVERHTDKILAIKWHDKRDVHVLSTVHPPGMSASGKTAHRTNEAIMKPIAVNSYNKNMGAVDKTDMQISFVECVRKSVKWYKKFFFHLLDISVLNSYIIFKTVRNKPKLQLGDYRLEVIRQLLEAHHQPRSNSKGGRRSQGDNPIRLTGRHFPSKVPATGIKKNAARVCVVCAHRTREAKRRRETTFMCKVCDVGLCAVPCFEIYHTIKTY